MSQPATGPNELMTANQPQMLGLVMDYQRRAIALDAAKANFEAAKEALLGAFGAAVEAPPGSSFFFKLPGYIVSLEREAASATNSDDLKAAYGSDPPEHVTVTYSVPLKNLHKLKKEDQELVAKCIRQRVKANKLTITKTP